MRLLSSFVAMVVAVPAYAVVPCEASVLHALQGGSIVMHVEGEDMLVGNTPRDNLRFAKEHILKAFSRFDCSNDDLRIKEDDYTNNRCTNVMPGDETTKVCYVTTKLGAVYVSTDMFGGVNLVFTRWD